MNQTPKKQPYVETLIALSAQHGKFAFPFFEHEDLKTYSLSAWTLLVREQRIAVIEHLKTQDDIVFFGTEDYAIYYAFSAAAIRGCQGSPSDEIKGLQAILRKCWDEMTPSQHEQMLDMEFVRKVYSEARSFDAVTRGSLVGIDWPVVIDGREVMTRWVYDLEKKDLACAQVKTGSSFWSWKFLGYPQIDAVRKSIKAKGADRFPHQTLDLLYMPGSPGDLPSMGDLQEIVVCAREAEKDWSASTEEPPQRG